MECGGLTPLSKLTRQGARSVPSALADGLRKSFLKDSSVLFIPFADANGTDFRADANTDLTK